MATKTLKPSPKKIVQLDVQTKITDALLQESMKIVMVSYKKYGADDKAAKGTDMVTDLRKEMRDKFGRKSKKA